ncbi:unnamed protein product, partial [Hapterophycus canaliculatus]
RANRTQLVKLERRLADLVADPRGTSTQLKPMASEDRKAAHELAVHYGLVTQSFDLEPKRYVSVIKQKGCRPPSRLLSTAAGDPSYRGTDEAVAEAAVVSASALERTMTNPNPRATALLGHAAGTPTTGGVGNDGSSYSPPATTSLGGGPRTSTVTSISSADPLAVDPVAAAAAATAAEAESKKTFFQRSKRRGVLAPSGTAASAASDTAAAGSGPPPTPSSSSSSPQSSSAAAAAAEARRGGQEAGHPQPGESGTKSSSNSSKGSPSDASAAAAAAAAGSTAGGDASRDKDGASTAAAGPENPGCFLVFHSVEAGLGRSDALLASVRTLVPARTVVGVRSATTAEAEAAGVQGVRGGGGGAASPPLVMEFTSELNAR